MKEEMEMIELVKKEEEKDIRISGRKKKTYQIVQFFCALFALFFIGAEFYCGADTVKICMNSGVSSIIHAFFALFLLICSICIFCPEVTPNYFLVPAGVTVLLVLTLINLISAEYCDCSVRGKVDGNCYTARRWTFFTSPIILICLFGFAAGQRFQKPKTVFYDIPLPNET